MACIRDNNSVKNMGYPHNKISLKQYFVSVRVK